MPISFRCPQCGRGYKVPDEVAGKTTQCKVCQARLTVPMPEVQASPEVEPEDLAAKLLLEGERYELKAPESSVDDPKPMQQPEPVRKPAKPIQPKIDVSDLPPLAMDTPPTWKRHLHWLLALALIPLVISMFTDDSKRLQDRIRATIESADVNTQDRMIESLEDDSKSIDQFLSMCPGNKLKGALLARDSWWPWGMAVVAILGYLAFIMFLAWGEVAKPLHVFLVGLFTATVGVGFLLLMQGLAAWTAGRVIVGKGIIALFFLILNLIAFSYRAASDPDTSFVLSFVGFTLGVGLCEEIVKLIPLFVYRNDEESHWRGMFLWGLASGAGFGIAEAIIYSDTMYNGLFTAEIYAVRFISCVALHAIWSGAAGMFLYQQRHLIDNAESWFTLVLSTIWIVAAVAVLHGLYDTALKKDMPIVALITAFVSFGYLAFLFSRNQKGDDAEAKADMLREYKRRKRQMA